MITNISCYSALSAFGGHLFSGALVTVQVFILSLFLSILLGMLGAISKTSSFAILRWISSAYSTVFRSIPELIIILAVYIGATMLIESIAASFGFDLHLSLNPFAAGVIALGITFGAYMTEVFRAGFAAVNKGEIEAGYAIGMSRALVLWRITLPQIWQHSLPGFGNVALVLLKDTSLLSIIGLNELMRETKVAIGYSSEPFTFYATAAIIYLLMTISVLSILHILEKKARIEGKTRYVF